MTTKKIAILIFSFMLLPAMLHAAEEGAAAAAPKPGADIKDRVKILRENRQKEMPYLDKAIIDSMIRPQEIWAKEQFINGEEKTLRELTARSIQVHTPTRAARERIVLARRRILAAVRNLFPEANFEVQSRNGSLSGFGFNSGSYRFNFRQPIFRGGILWNSFMQEKAGLDAAEKEYRAVIQDLVSEVATAYFEYSRAQEVVKTQTENIQKLKEYSDISEQKFDQQIISEIEHLNVQSLYSQIQYDNETSKQELELAKLDLQRYLDLDLDDNIRVKPLYDIDDLLMREEKEDIPGQDPNEPYAFEGERAVPVLNDLVDMAYQYRSELQVEAAKLDAARLQERIRWGEMIPKADVILEFGKLGEAFDEITMDPSLKKEVRVGVEFNWNLGGNKINYTTEQDERAPSVTAVQGQSGTFIRRQSMRVGLMDGLQELAAIKEAEVARLDQITQLEKTEKEVVHDVKQSYFDYQKARIRVKSTLQRVNYRKRLSDLSRHRLTKNEIEISEFMQSQIDLMQELATLHKALADYFTAKAKLNHAIGVRDYFSIEELDGSKPGTK